MKFNAKSLLKSVSLILLLGLLLPSCKLIYPEFMFKQKEYQTFEFREQLIKQYVIKPYDQFTMSIFARDGFRLIDVTTSANNFNINNNNSSSIFYIVDANGYVKLPTVGELNVAGYTEEELERLLSERISAFIVDPFVEVRVINRRCFVFSGSNGGVVPLNQSPTTLFEVIAKSGGIAAGLKAYKIKLIRGDLKNPQVTVIDLSTIEGMQKSNLIVQSNDIIYIEPRRRFVRDILAETTVIFSIVSTVVSLYILGRTIN